MQFNIDCNCKFFVDLLWSKKRTESILHLDFRNQLLYRSDSCKFFSRYKYIYNQFRKILQKKGRINKSVSIKATFNMFIVVLLLALFIYLVFSSGLLVFFINPVGKSEIFLLTVRVVGGICFFIFTFPIVILFEIFYIYLLRLLIVYKNWYCKGILDTFCWKVQNTLLFFLEEFRSTFWDRRRLLKKSMY